MIKILIADDVEIIRNNIAKIISNINIDEINLIGVAKNFEEEKYMIENLNPDVVITNVVKKERKSIFEIEKIYCNRKDTPKFILVSGLDKEFIRYEVTKNKLDNIIGFIHKPFSEQSIIKYIEKIIKENFIV